MGRSQPRERGRRGRRDSAAVRGFHARSGDAGRLNYLGKVCLLRSLLVLLLVSQCAWADPAERYFNKGRKAARQGDDVNAYLFFAQAKAFNPTERRYALAADMARKRAGQTLAGLGEFGVAASIDPANRFLLAGAAPRESPPASAGASPLTGNVRRNVRRNARRLQPPVHLEPAHKTASFDLKDKVSVVYEKVAEEFGLGVVFDRDFDGDRDIRLVLDDCDFVDAIRVLNEIVLGFVVPLNPRLFLVAEDTRTKRTELEPMATVIIPIPDAMSDEETQQLGQLVQQILEVKRLQVDRIRRQVILRDTVHRVRLAQALYEQLSHGRAEVLLEIDLLATNTNDQLDLGVRLPAAFPLTNFSTVLQAVPAMAAGVPLVGFGGGKTVFGVAIGDAGLIAQRTQSAARSILKLQLRSTDGLPAEITIGERFPIINATFSVGVANQQPFPSFTFENLGITLSVTPRVHSATEVSLEMEFQVQLLSGSSTNDIPILSNRQFTSSFRLRQGEVAMISGMKIYERRGNQSGLAWLSQIPLLGRLFRDTSRQFNESDLVVVIRPRIVRLPAAEVARSEPLRYGPETRPLSAL